MPEGKPLYRAELVPHTTDQNNLLEFYIYYPDGDIRKLWIRTSGAVKLESRRGSMQELMVPNTRLKGIAMVAESSTEHGAILNAVGLEINKNSFQRTQARWALNEWLEALRKMYIGRTYLRKQTAKEDPMKEIGGRKK